jgi:hypothetical protein
MMMMMMMVYLLDQSQKENFVEYTDLTQPSDPCIRRRRRRRRIKRSLLKTY